MDIAHPLPSKIKSLSFGFLTTDDIRRVSVKQIVNPVLLDNTGRPTKGGLYDPALGPSERGDICATCGLDSFSCPGHYGHIELPVPAYHPLFFTNTFNLLRGCCMYCHHFKLAPSVLIKYTAKLSLLDYGRLDEVEQVDEISRMEKPAPSDEPAEDDSASASPSKSKAKSKEDEEREKDEGLANYKRRVDAFVARVISAAKQAGASRDEYKTGLVYQARKRLIHELLKSVNTKKCQHCGAHSHGFRKEGHTKIIEYALTPKQAAQHAALGRVRPDVLRAQARLDRAQRAAAAKASAREARDAEPMDEDDESESETESEGEGENLVPQAGAAASAGADDEEDEEEEEDEDDDDTGKRASAASSRARSERVVPSSEVHAHLRLLFSNEPQLTALLFARHGPFPTSSASPSMFFMTVIPVPPTRFRPAARMGDGPLMEHPQNELLSAVLQTSFRVRDLNDELRSLGAKGQGGGKESKEKRDRTYAQLLEAIITLQHGVNSFMDSSKNPARLPAGKEPTPGVKQVLEKKEGLFRKHMMGKRVNYAARSVISPDVNIETSEIGVPPVFAKTLTYPEPVTPLNVQEMMQLVKNGPNVYPGASMIQHEDGRLESLDKKTPEQRAAIANQLLTPSENRGSAGGASGAPTTRTQAINKKVYRHLRDGDVLLLNRQPTLHKPSMMAHKARVLKGERTIRMHYANCKSYNADFDGDEMNMHFAQSAIARAEMMLIANNDNQYLVPTSGKPLRGLIQDHVVSGVWMTAKTTMFDRDEYFQLIYGALRPEDDYSGGGRVITLPPAIWKPKPMWTGKQIISTVLANITPDNAKGLNLHSSAKVKAEYWPAWGAEENKVVFADGELVCGILDSSQFGNTSYGLVHAVHELYGPAIAGKLLSILSRLFTKFLQHRAFTCRMDDLLLTPEGDADRQKILDETKNSGTEAAFENVGLCGEDATGPNAARNLRVRLEEVLRDDLKLAALDSDISAKAEEVKSKILGKTLPHGLARRFPHNHFQAMVLTGAKGSNVNASQISCLLGQQSLEGRRVPVMVSGKTLPSFKAFETDARAGGFVAQRFLTGIRPQEYYFHCMAGREGLIDTAVKTSRSGYLQRCLIKHLEGIRVHYDHTVRDSDSSVIQFHYGEDSLDVTKQTYLDKFDFALRNYESMARRYNPKALIGKVDEDKAVEHMKKALRKPHKYDPTMSLYSPSRFLGSTSEKFARKIDEYADANPANLLASKKASEEAEAKKRGGAFAKPKQFKNLMRTVYARSLVEPGEAVGLLASQGVGEPSTQMTLNTFHFAGHGAANVTLGIPRLREIVMTASANIKTPTMKLPIKQDVTEAQMQTFCKDASRLTLSQTVDEVTVTESLSAKTSENAFSRRKTYAVKLALFPPEEYRAEYNVEPAQVFASMRSFAAILDREITTELRKVTREQTGSAANIGKGMAMRERRGGAEAGEEDEDVPVRGRGNDEDETGDGDADEARRVGQSKEQASYSDDEPDGPGDPDDVEGMFNKGAPRRSGPDEDDEMDEDEDLDEEAQAELRAKAISERLTTLEEDIVAKSHYMTKLSFDRSGKAIDFELEFSSKALKLLLVGIIEAACRKAVVHEIPGISRALLLAPEKGKDGKPLPYRTIQTEGNNFLGMWWFGKDIVDIDKIYSNDIDAIRRTYGVEAARAAIINEVGAVFGVYGIDVNFRHLSLLADYMTFDGTYRPFNRTGIANNVSTLAKASFETTSTFIAEAALHGDFDTLENPSARLVVGLPTFVGSASNFEVGLPAVAAAA